MVNIREIEVTDEDINWVEDLMGEDIEFDLQRREIIKNLDSVDIQAFPGSGKTTVLVAKLAILAKKWKTNHVGICVLSHTNVAREEIEKRLGNTEVGTKLLGYPHFIGTVHSFFSKFVALPWLKSQGKSIDVIDTAITVNSRWTNLPYKYRKVLENKRLTEVNCAYSKEVGNIKLGKLGSHTTTYQVVKKIIENSHDDGLYTYDEILLFSREAINRLENLSEIISSRFPIIFLDEAQDTSEFQYSLINDCFALSIEQGFGDENQAIYNYIGEQATTRFPRSAPLVISESKRFSNDIAQLANSLAVSRTKMGGLNSKFEGNKNTIFLFSKDDIESLFKEYGRLIFETFTEEEIDSSSSDGCYAIGLVHKKTEETPKNQYPKGIYDYLPSYNPWTMSKGYKPKLLIDYFRIGRYEFEKSLESHTKFKYILEGLRVLINIEKRENVLKRSHTNQLNIFDDILEENSKILFRKHLLKIFEMNLENNEEWKVIVSEIKDIIEIFDMNIEHSKYFLRWEPLNKFGSDMEEKLRGENVVFVEQDNRKVSIKLDSIHGVKGKTHLSTLVLETYNYKHCLKSLIPFITKTTDKRNLGIREIQKMKTHYVAMTRPKGLLCLGIPNDEVNSDEVKQLEEVGWKVMKV